MPTSDPRYLTTVADTIKNLQPKSVLDIGVGMGKWGLLTREYTDVWNYRFYADEWKTKLVGLEIHPKYQTGVWEVYDEIIFGDAMDTVEKAAALSDGGFDLTIMIDVLEHFEKERGKQLIDKVLRVSRHFLVSYWNSGQKDVRDNKYEDHLSQWCFKDFVPYKAKILDRGLPQFPEVCGLFLLRGCL